MSSLPLALLLALLLTELAEVGVFILTGHRDRRDLALLLLVNLLTNPLVVCAYWLIALYTTWDRLLVRAVLELLVLFTEAFYYHRYAAHIRRPFLFSLQANAASYLTGILFQTFY